MNPRLNGLFVKDKSQNLSPVRSNVFETATENAESSHRDRKYLSDRYGSDFIYDFSLLNPIKIIEEIPVSSFRAATLCQHACAVIGDGYRRRVLDYISTAYAIALAMRDDDRQIALLSLAVTDGRTKRSLDPEKVRAGLLHYLFLFVFFESGMTKRDRATQYAQALQPYFDGGTPATDVRQRLHKHGPDRLRRAAQLRTKSLQDAQAWAESGRSAPMAMDEAVAAVAADDAAKNPAPPIDEPTDFGPRALPSDVGFGNGHDTSNGWDDFDLLAEDADDTEDHNDVDEIDVSDEEGDEDSLEDDSDELLQPPEVDEFFSSAMHMTAQLVVGLRNHAMTTDDRAALTGVAIKLATNIAAFRGLLA